MISKKDCVVGTVYRLRSRNLNVGVFTGRGFIGIREKFGDKYLFQEFHHEDGPPFGTVNPIAEIARVSDDTPLTTESEGLFNVLMDLEKKENELNLEGKEGGA